MLVAADVLRQSVEPLAGPSEEPLADPTEELLADPSEELLADPSEEPLADPSEELLAGPSAPPADRQPDDSHQQQEASTSQEAAAMSPVTTVNEQPELRLALQQAAEGHSVVPNQAASQQTPRSEPGSPEASQSEPHDSNAALHQAINTSSMSAAPQECQTASSTFSEQASASETAPALSVRQTGGSPALQQAADAQEGPSAHHDAESNSSSQQALPSSEASNPLAASHVNAPSVQTEAEHDQQSALTADSEGSAAPESEPAPTDESWVGGDVDVIPRSSPATEGHHAAPNPSSAEDGLTETSKVAFEGVTTSSASSMSAASPPVKEEEPTGAEVTAGSDQAGAAPDGSVKPSSPVDVQALNSFSMPPKNGQLGAVPSSPVEGPNSPQGMQDSGSAATSQVALSKAESNAEAPTVTGSAPTAAAVHTAAGAKITSTADLQLLTSEIAAGTDKAAAKATVGLPPTNGHASQNAPTATATLEARDMAAAEATTGVPPAMTGACQHVHPATTETKAGSPSGCAVATASATASVVPDPDSAGMHSAAPEARAALNSPVVLPDSAVAVSTAESAGRSRDRAAADDLGMGAEAESVPAAPATKAKSRSKLKSVSKPKSKARAALEEPAAAAEGDTIAARHPAGHTDTKGKPKTKKRSARGTAAASAAVKAAAVPESACMTAPDAVAAADAAEPVPSGVEGCADSKYEVVPGDQRLERLKDPKARQLASGATAVVYR